MNPSTALCIVDCAHGQNDSTKMKTVNDDENFKPIWFAVRIRVIVILEYDLILLHSLNV